MNATALRDAARLILSSRRDERIDPRWFIRRTSRIHQAFTSGARLIAAPDPFEESFDQITINGQRFVWPRSAPREELLRIACELQVTSHPHQYFWGPTTVAAGDVVIDVGACEGAFSAAAAEKGARPIAVEPSPLMRRVIRRLFAVRNLPEPTIVPYALSAASGTARFTDDGANVQASRLAIPEAEGPAADPGYGDPRTADPQPANTPSADTGLADLGQADTGYAVAVRTLDDVVDELRLPRVDFIKCDAEGADLDILRSARRTLERFHPKLAFCTYHQRSHFREMVAFLRPLGYRIRGKGLIHTGQSAVVVLLHAV